MGGKVRCPSCGAKNDALARRCRVCTVIINMDAPEEGKEEPLPQTSSSPLDDHFDASVINSQMRSASSKLGGGGGALSARIAAAGTAGANSRYAGLQGDASNAPAPRPEPVPQSDPFSSLPPLGGGGGGGADETFEPMSFESSSFGGAHGPSPEPTPAPQESYDWSSDSLFDKSATPAPAPPPAPAPSADEPFDPDALFRDMGR